MSRGEEPRTIALLRAVVTPTGNFAAFEQELAARGSVIDRNVRVIPSNPAEVHTEPADVQATVRRWVEVEGADLIVAYSTSGAELAAEAAPRTPVLFVSNDPVASGLVDDPAEPEANLTGVTFRVPADRTLSLARRALQGIDTVGLVYPESDPAAIPYRDGIEEAARDVGLRVEVASFTGFDDAADAVEEVAAAGVDAVVLANAPVAIVARDAVIAAASTAGLPVIANTDVAVGAVVIVSPDGVTLNRQLGAQAARLLAGVSVRDVPVEDPRTFRVVIDVGQASRLGIGVAEEVLREADEVVR